MRHKNFTTTQRYAHHYSESLRNGIKALEASRAERAQKFSTNLAQSAQGTQDFVIPGVPQPIEMIGAGGRNRTDTGLWPTGF